MAKKLTAAVVVILMAAVSVILVTRFDGRSDGNGSAERISGAKKALDFWSAQRAYPGKTIPDEGHYAAYETAGQAVAEIGFRAEPVELWRAIGPTNLGGRTLAVAFNPLNPNTIYAGSASGGLWRSFSGGRGVDAWERISTGYPVLGVSSIAFAPADSGTIYIGTGEVYSYQNVGYGAAYRSTRGTYGIGILKTTNGGVSWEKSLDWSYNQTRGVWAVKLNPLNPNTVWAGTTEGTYKSTDAGGTWNRKHDVVMVMDLALSPADTNIVFAACGNFESEGYGIYRTTDGGGAWTKLGDDLPVVFKGKAQLAVCESAPHNVYVSIGNGFSSWDGYSWLCKSTDDGDTWDVVSQKDYSKWQGWFSHDVAVNPSDPNEVFAVGIDIWKSTTGGSDLSQVSSNTWYTGRVPPEGPEGPPTYSHCDHHDVIYHPTDPDVVYFGNDGGIFRTMDGGNTFESCNGGFQTGQFYAGFSSSATDSLLAMGGFQDNGSAIYDGSEVWLVKVIGGDGSWTAIDPVNPYTMYGSYQYLGLLKSTNAGGSWDYLPVPGSSRLTCFIAPYLLAYDDPQVIYGGRDIVYKSTNGGYDWTPTNGGATLDTNPVLAMAISHQDQNVVYAATAPYYTRPGAFRTTNGGDDWTDITGNLPDRYPGDMAVDPTNDATVYIAFSGFGSSHLFKSVDGGDTWDDIGTGLPDVPTSAVAVDPLYPDHIYVGNDIGVFVSLDGGDNWYSLRAGLPKALIVLDLSISPMNRILRLASHGNGAYEHRLLGNTAVTGEETATTSVPAGLSLRGNFPNPFNPVTTIPYEIPKPGPVSLVIYNMRGEKVKTLVDDAHQEPGSRTVIWDGSTDRGNPAASGTYICRLTACGGRRTVRMVLVR